MLDRNRPNVVSKDEIHKLEDKIKDLEDQIFNAKKKGEETKKLDFLEKHLQKTDSSFVQEERRDLQNSTRAIGESECEKIFSSNSEEEDLLSGGNPTMKIQQTPHILHNFSEHLESSMS